MAYVPARIRLQVADLLGPGSEDQEVELGACERPPGHDGVHRHALPGRPTSSVRLRLQDADLL
eukprot:11652596-Heterocapsa_arctica.AAC.1